jgi:curved DNA-binding protein
LDEARSFERRWRSIGFEFARFCSRCRAVEFVLAARIEQQKRYDRLGSDWKAGAEFRPPPGWEEATVELGDLGDLFAGDRFGGFSDFFATLFGGRRHAFRGGAGFRMRGRDIEVELPVTLEEAHRGTTRSLALDIEDTVPLDTWSWRI